MLTFSFIVFFLGLAEGMGVVWLSILLAVVVVAALVWIGALVRIGAWPRTGCVAQRSRTELLGTGDSDDPDRLRNSPRRLSSGAALRLGRPRSSVGANRYPVRARRSLPPLPKPL